MDNLRMSVWSFLNVLIERYDLKSYLEIGYGHGWGYSRVRCAEKVTIDPCPAQPDPLVTRVTSDEFFRTLNPEKKFDLIFVDGDHSATQVHKDICNGLTHLSSRGFIVCHDACPLREEWTDRSTSGDGWRAIIQCRTEHPLMEVSLLDYVGWSQFGMDMVGWAIVRPGTQKLYRLPEGVTFANVNYEYLDAHRRELLNIQSLSEFLRDSDRRAGIPNRPLYYVSDVGIEVKIPI